MQNNLLTIKEVAHVLKVSVATVHNYIQKGLLRAIKLTRDYRVDREDLNKFLKVHEYHT